jgi:hypothetical protein
VDKRTIILAHDTARRTAVDAVMTAPAGYVVTIAPPKKTRPQEERYHTMIGDIADQWRFLGRKFDKEDMKRLCLDQFRRDTIKDPDYAQDWAEIGGGELAPSIDGSGVVQLGVQSRRLTKKLGSAFIEWLFALGGEQGVRWTDDDFVQRTFQR